MPVHRKIFSIDVQVLNLLQITANFHNTVFSCIGKELRVWSITFQNFNFKGHPTVHASQTGNGRSLQKKKQA